MTWLQTTSDWLDPNLDQKEFTRRLTEWAFSLVDRNLLLVVIFSAIMALWCLWVCYRGMLKKESFLIPSPLLVLVASLPYLFGYTILISLGRNPLDRPLGLAEFVATICLIWFLLGHRVAFGVTDRSIRTAIADTTSELRIPSVESFSSFSLPTRSMEVQVSVHAWIGIALIRFKRKDKRFSNRTLVEGIDRNLRLHPGDRTTVIFWLHLALAAVFLATIAFSVSTMLRH